MDPELSLIKILGGFAREVIDTERGLWRTFKNLTLRPGSAVKDYLAGTRRPFTSPGRYLFTAALLIAGTNAILRGLGASGSGFGDLASMVQGFTEAARDAEAGLPTDSAWRVIVELLNQLGSAPAFVLVIVAGMAGLLYRHFFYGETSSLAADFAISAYGTAHAALLYQSSYVAVKLAHHYGAVGHQAHGVAVRILFFTFPLYMGVLTYDCFEPSWWNGVKGAVGPVVASVETVLLVIAGLSVYAEWLVWSRPERYAGSAGYTDTAVIAGGLVLVFHGILALAARYVH